MNRKTKLLSGLNISAATGAEIGALCRPIVTRGEGQIYYVDHTSTAELREKYRNHADVKIGELVEVDAVWGEQSLSEALDHKRFDYVIASHVVEHVPDLVGWLSEVNEILKPEGQIRLVVPDKRFTFDLMREESRLSDVLAAYVVKARVPQTQAILDHMLNVRNDVHAAERWNGIPSDGMQAHSLGEAITAAQNAAANGTYHDVHCWVFTPASFARICAKLAESGLLQMACANFFDTATNELEFQVHLQRCSDLEQAVDSWMRMERSVVPDDPKDNGPRYRFRLSSGPRLLYYFARRMRQRTR